jgi:endogenous inhibitor of DNA gyrase (YacG/DUF329 family)
VKAGAFPRAPHILFMPAAQVHKACPICGRPAAETFRPFCSRRCADVDLNRWLSGVYAIQVSEDEEEDERRDEGAGELN